LNYTQDVLSAPDGVERPWRHIRQVDLAEYYDKFDTDNVSAVNILANILGLDNVKYDTRQSAILTFTALVLRFARDHHYSPVKCAVLFNISESLLDLVRKAGALEELQKSEPHANSWYFRHATIEVSIAGHV
jgi:hypothetical protein